MDLQWSPLQYWPCHAGGQFFHFQCMQSIEPNIPGNTCASPICSRRLMSLLFGLLKYSSPNISLTPLKKASKNWIAVHSSILMYLSTLSAGDLYANIQIFVVHLCNGERPPLPIALDLIRKYESWLLRTSTIWRNICFCIWNLHRKIHLRCNTVIKSHQNEKGSRGCASMRLYNWGWLKEINWYYLQKTIWSLKKI